MKKKIQVTDFIRRDGTIDPRRARVSDGYSEVTITRQSRNWSLRLYASGRHHCVPLRTGDRATAASRAIDEARKILRGEEPLAQKRSGACISLGEIISLYRDSGVPLAAAETREAYISCLRIMVREALGIARRVVRVDGVVEEPAVDSLKASVLTVKLIRAFQDARLKGVPEGKRREAAKRTANTVLVNARSIFARGILKEGLYPNLPDLSRFLELPKLPAMKVVFKFEAIEEPVARVMKALPELRESDPAAYLLFRLAAGLGLRRREAVEARRSWIESFRGRRVLYVQPTEDWLPKGRKERRIPLPEDIYSDILLLSDGGEHIIPTRSARYWTPPFRNRRGKLVKGAWRSTGKSGSKNERVNGIGRRLARWLNEQGWPLAKKAHELRRWFGAQVAVQTGSLFEAQRILGHASPETTDQYYSDLVRLPDYEINMEGESVDNSAAGGV